MKDLKAKTNDVTIAMNGEGFISQRETSRLTGIPRVTLQRLIKSNIEECSGQGYKVNENNQLNEDLFIKVVKVGQSKGLIKSELLMNRK